MTKEFVNEPLIAKLVGGPLDGDEFELIPNGSILPPMRFSYGYRSNINGIDTACWLNYEHDKIAEWAQGVVLYYFVGIEPM